MFNRMSNFCVDFVTRKTFSQRSVPSLVTNHPYLVTTGILGVTAKYLQVTLGVFVLGLEKRLSCLEDHVVEDLKQLIHKQPCAIGGALLAVSVHHEPPLVLHK